MKKSLYYVLFIFRLLQTEHTSISSIQSSRTCYLNDGEAWLYEDWKVATSTKLKWCIIIFHITIK